MSLGTVRPPIPVQSLASAPERAAAPASPEGSPAAAGGSGSGVSAVEDALRRAEAYLAEQAQVPARSIANLANNYFCEISNLKIFSWLVLGCIKTKFCKKICV